MRCNALHFEVCGARSDQKCRVYSIRAVGHSFAFTHTPRPLPTFLIVQNGLFFSVGSFGPWLLDAGVRPIAVKLSYGFFPVELRVKPGFEHFQRGHP